MKSLINTNNSKSKEGKHSADSFIFNNAKPLFNNTVSQFIGRTFSTTLSFIVTYLIIRNMGTSSYGDFIKVTSLLSLNYTFIDFGLNAIILRSFADSDDDHRADLINKTFALRFSISILLIVATTVFMSLFPHKYPRNLISAYILGSISLFLFSMQKTYNAIFQFNLEYYKSAISNMLGSIAFLMAVLLVLRMRPTTTHLILAFLLNQAITMLTSLFFTKLIPSIQRIKPKDIYRLLKLSAFLGASLVFSTFANKLDVVVISVFRSSAEVGQYSFAYKIFEFALMVPVLVTNSSYPFLVKKLTSRRKITNELIKFLFVSSLVVGVAMYSLAPLILLVRSSLQPSISILRSLVISLPIFYTTAPIMWYLISVGKEKTLLKTYISAGILNLLFNLIFVPSFGAISSAYITLLTELMILIQLVYTMKSHTPTKNDI